jgi:TonB family protein
VDERECACDEEVVHMGTDTWSYAAGILRLTSLCFALAMTVAPMTLSALDVTSKGQEPDVYSIKETGLTPPKLVRQTQPDYTLQAMRARIQGIVKLEAVVLTDGKVGDVKITQSLDKKFGLDKRAIATVKNWKFEPGRKDDKAVPVRIDIELSFKLK